MQANAPNKKWTPMYAIQYLRFEGAGSEELGAGVRFSSEYSLERIEHSEAVLFGGQSADDKYRIPVTRR